MKWSFASVGLIILGLFGIVIILLFNDITVSNEQDYYTLKYATEAAMLESIDVAYYRLTGEVKMSQEKFVENFTRRFTETSTFGQGNYNIAFYQISEYPPKVSLRIYDATSDYNIYTYNSDVEATSTGIVNELSAILDGEKLDLKYKEAEKPKEAPKETPPSYTPPSNRPSYTPSYTPTYPFRPSSYIPSYPSTDYYVPSSGGGYDSGGDGGGGGGGCDNCCLCGTCGGYQCSAEGANEGDVLGRTITGVQMQTVTSSVIQAAAAITMVAVAVLAEMAAVLAEMAVALAEMAVALAEMAAAMAAVLAEMVAEMAAADTVASLKEPK